MRIEDYIKRNAEKYPSKPALICGDESCTYSELYRKVRTRAKELNVGGVIVPFRAIPSIDALVEYFAIHEAHGIAAPLDKSLPDDLFDAIGSHSIDIEPNIADLLFTTGTTGKPKGALIPHLAIIANAENLIEAQHFHPDLMFIVNGPLNHLGSLSKIYPCIYIGATVHIVDGLKDLETFFAAFDSSYAPSTKKYATFLVPDSIRMLLVLAKKRLSQLADRIEFIETGAAPMTQQDMETLCEILPYSRLYNTYASTETGIVSTFNFNEGECIADCVGKPMLHSEILITPENTIACKGDTLMAGYIDGYNPKSPPTTIITSDLGDIDSKGRLHLKGRSDDIINVGGFKVNPIEVEEVAMSYPGIRDCACVSSKNPILGTILKLLIVADRETNRRSLVEYMKSRLESYKIPAVIEYSNIIPHNRNGKIDRQMLNNK